MVVYFIVSLLIGSSIIYLQMGLRDALRTSNIIAIAGSAGLIILYVLSRTLNLPLIGFEEHVGSVDLLSKILQVGIIIGSTILLLSQGKQEMTKLHAQA
jgi:hypothetical protein